MRQEGRPRTRQIDRAPSRPRTRSAHPKGHATEAEAGTQARSHRIAFAIVLPVTPKLEGDRVITPAVEAQVGGRQSETLVRGGGDGAPKDLLEG